MSRQADPTSAVIEAIRIAKNQFNASQVEWVLVFFTPPHIPHAEQIWQTIKSQTHCECIAGCSGTGVISGMGEIEGSPGISIMLGSLPGIESRALAKIQVAPDAPSVSQQLKETLEAFHGPSPLFLFFPDAYQHLPYNFINTLNYVSTHPNSFGAGSCDDGIQRRSVQLGPEGVVRHGISGLCFGDISDFSVGITQSCTPIGDPMFITEVRDNMIVSLDGYPALEVYATVASNMGLSTIEEAAEHVLICFPLNKEVPEFTGENSLARNLDGIDVVSKGLMVPQIVQEGEVLSLAYRSGPTAEQDLYDMLNRLKQSVPKTPTFGIYLNCSARGPGLYGRPDVDSHAIREVLGEFPLIGFFGGYELASVSMGLQLYSYTGVLLLVTL